MSIVVVNCNGEKYLGRCLDSLTKLDKPDHEVEIIVVDNNSSDNSWRIVEQYQAKLVRLKENLGAAEGRDVGLNNSRGQFILFVDNDIIAHPLMLKELVKVAKSDNQIGAVFGKMLSYDEYPGIKQEGYEPVSYISWTGKLMGQRGEAGKYIETNYVHGTAFLIKREVAEKLGYLCDPRYFVYYEDVDLSLRVISKGYKIVYVPTAYFWHRVQEVQGKYFHYLDARNKVLSFYKSFEWEIFLRMLPLLVIGDLMMLLDFFNSRIIRNALMRLKAYIDAVKLIETKFKYDAKMRIEEQQRVLKSLILPPVEAGSRVVRIVRRGLRGIVSAYVKASFGY